jgi:hypothetical protein
MNIYPIFTHRENKVFFLFVAFISISLVGFSQGKKAKPVKAYEFEEVQIMNRSNLTNTYVQNSQFTGKGKILIFNDSITITYSNEWESGTYRMFIDTVNILSGEYENGRETLVNYSVRTKGYHDIDGVLILMDIEGNDGSKALSIVLDTKYDETGYAAMRRTYWNIKAVKQ